MSGNKNVFVPAADGRTYPCGHPRTEDNTQSIGKAGERCRICRRRISLASKVRRSAIKSLNVMATA